ncbi:MAG: peptidase S58 family protein, partial [Pseudopedobacter sp.]|nr:peptidase S58 family protein [Deinococcales bacterium]
AVATGEVVVKSPLELSRIGAVAADTLGRAIVHAILQARSIPGFPAYRDLI